MSLPIEEKPKPQARSSSLEAVLTDSMRERFSNLNAPLVVAASPIKSIFARLLAPTATWVSVCGAAERCQDQNLRPDGSITEIVSRCHGSQQKIWLPRGGSDDFD